MTVLDGSTSAHDGGCVTSRKKPRTPGPTVPKSARQLPATREMLDGVRYELVERIAAVESKLTGEIVRVESKLSGQMHEVRADVARLGVLIEEQNARNSIVFEALHAVVEQQKRFDTRLTSVE
ncbi:MAG: hypothetical protein WCJ30_24445, partial [Deltaproteobacteria bacterium]